MADLRMTEIQAEVWSFLLTRRHAGEENAMPRAGHGVQCGADKTVASTTNLSRASGIDCFLNSLSGFRIKSLRSVEKTGRLILVANDLDSSPLQNIIPRGSTNGFLKSRVLGRGDLTS